MEFNVMDITSRNGMGFLGLNTLYKCKYLQDFSSKLQEYFLAFYIYSVFDIVRSWIIFSDEMSNFVSLTLCQKRNS